MTFGKEQLMTIMKFNEYNKNAAMPREWIGQGFGYKSEWDPNHPTDIIYIPEYGYEEEDDTKNVVLRENAFSYNDFVDMCDGNEKKAKAVFDNADWQFPRGILEEPWFEWEE